MNAPTHGEAQDATLALNVCVSACVRLECGWVLRQATVLRAPTMRRGHWIRNVFRGARPWRIPSCCEA
eukprot:7632752-Pyramimonas_sp.AAC.1